MIIDVHKLEPIDNIKVDLNDDTFIYFLFAIDEHTPRYSRVDGGYVHNPYGSIIMDHGYDVWHKHKRTLLYIGETASNISRIYNHWVEKNPIKGTGPIFTHVRRIRNPNFIYDSVRLHYECVLVRKYLPKINKNANFTETQITILKNSKGRIKPQDILKPYCLNYRDIITAFHAWDKEDLNYFTDVLQIKPTYNKLGEPMHYRQEEKNFYKENKKLSFGKFVSDVVRAVHPKMKKEMSLYFKNRLTWIKLFAPTTHAKKIKKDRERMRKRYIENRKEIIARSNQWRKLRNAEKKKKSNSKGIETQP